MSVRRVVNEYGAWEVIADGDDVNSMRGQLECYGNKSFVGKLFGSVDVADPWITRQAAVISWSETYDPGKHGDKEKDQS